MNRVHGTVWDRSLGGLVSGSDWHADKEKRKLREKKNYSHTHLMLEWRVLVVACLIVISCQLWTEACSGRRRWGKIDVLLLMLTGWLLICLMIVVWIVGEDGVREWVKWWSARGSHAMWTAWNRRWSSKKGSIYFY